MKVIDSSSLVKYVCREEGWDKVRGHLATGCATLDLAFKEVSNALWKKVLRGDLKKEKAVRIVEVLAKSRLVKTYEETMLLTAAFKISVETSITVYDSLFIALAQKLGSPLITSDKAQAEKAEETGVTVLLV